MTHGPSDAFALEHVSVQYGAAHALSDVTLHIAAGERVALVGPSGAGKSTLLGLLNGSRAASSGSVRSLGVDLRRAGARERRATQAQIGMIQQQLHLVRALPVIHNVNAGRLSRWSLWTALSQLIWPRDIDAPRRALARVGIADKLFAPTDTLSGGEQQRVAIARALMQEPRALLADEPVSSLDPARSRDVLTLLTDLSRASGCTLVVSLHLPEHALTFCDRVIGLRAGRVVFDTRSASVTPAMTQALYALPETGGSVTGAAA